MHLHAVIEYSCELKSNGDVTFLRGVAPVAMWRDLEQRVASFADHRSLRSGEAVALPADLAWDDPARLSDDEMQRQLVTLPRFARREKDPPDGRVSGAALLARARKVLDKGQICRHCPAAAANPERFGCWTALVLPADAHLVAWVLERWRATCEERGRSEVALLARLHAKRGATYRLLLPPEERTPAARAARTTHLLAGGRRDPLSVDALFGLLLTLRNLEPHHQLALLHDFGALHADEWRRLAELRTEAPAVGAPWDASPFLLQPRPSDPPSVLAFLSFLYLCYWAAHMGRRLLVQPVAIHDDVGRFAA